MAFPLDFLASSLVALECLYEAHGRFVAGDVCFGPKRGTTMLLEVFFNAEAENPLQAQGLFHHLKVQFWDVNQGGRFRRRR